MVLVGADVRPGDAGSYMCQISTYPAKVLHRTLIVKGRKFGHLCLARRDLARPIRRQRVIVYSFTTYPAKFFHRTLIVKSRKFGHLYLARRDLARPIRRQRVIVYHLYLYDQGPQDSNRQKQEIWPFVSSPQGHSQINMKT